MAVRQTLFVMVLSMSLILLGAGTLLAGQKCCPGGDKLDCSTGMKLTAVKTSGTLSATASTAAATTGPRVVAIPVSVWNASASTGLRMVSSSSAGQCTPVPLSQCTPEMRKNCVPVTQCGSGPCKPVPAGQCNNVTKTTATNLESSI